MRLVQCGVVTFARRLREPQLPKFVFGLPRRPDRAIAAGSVDVLAAERRRRVAKDALILFQ